MEPPKESDYYADLKIERTATAAQVKKAYHSLAIVHHPDKKAPGEKIDAAEFRKIKAAYDVLGDANQRTSYDWRHESIRKHWKMYREWEKTKNQARGQHEANLAAGFAAMDLDEDELDPPDIRGPSSGHCKHTGFGGNTRVNRRGTCAVCREEGVFCFGCPRCPLVMCIGCSQSGFVPFQ